MDIFLPIWKEAVLTVVLDFLILHIDSIIQPRLGYHLLFEDAAEDDSILDLFYCCLLTALLGLSMVVQGPWYLLPVSIAMIPAGLVPAVFFGLYLLYAIDEEMGLVALGWARRLAERIEHYRWLALA